MSIKSKPYSRAAAKSLEKALLLKPGDARAKELLEKSR
jgi:hypothetical protein